MIRDPHEITHYAVVGAGHGGKAMAANLALKGFSVALYNRTPKNVEAIRIRGGILLERDDLGVSGFGELALVTSDMEAALDEAQIIMVVVPAFAHADIARKMAPCLQDGQIVILNPGRTLGALEFRQVLVKEGCQADAIIAETQTFIYASRSDGPAHAHIFRSKEAVPLAALPSSRTAEVLAAIKPAYPQFIDGETVLHTGINNIGAVFHPTITLHNAAWIEGTGGNFEFYMDGVTHTVSLTMEAIDRERMRIAETLGIEAITAQEWLMMAYNSEGEDLREAIHNQPGYRGIRAPATIKHRYITEDIPFSLVPLASLGRRYGIRVRAMESIIRLACIAHRRDYWESGRTLESLGIDQLEAHELLGFIEQPIPDFTVAHH